MSEELDGLFLREITLLLRVVSFDILNEVFALLLDIVYAVVSEPLLELTVDGCQEHIE